MSNGLIHETKKYDVVVVGGGMSGVCAAIAAARHGAKTALVQNRPVLGGNASSEIRMHICGADIHGTRLEARETGIIEELLLYNRKVNPQISFSVWDTVLWEKTTMQGGLDLFLNTHVFEAIQENDVIKSVRGVQQTTEKMICFCADIFIDATGDGTLGYLSGADYMTGREGRDVFGEACAPPKSDVVTMGNSLLFTSKDMGYPVPFEKPDWAYTYGEEDLKFRDHREVDAGYWWVELGGDETSTIHDGEVIRDELLKSVYGVWDHIKNQGDHAADNLVLDWVGMLPGKRESRRLTGDYVLTADDLQAGRRFHDAVAYGGWPMDMHLVGGLKGDVEEPTEMFFLDDIYTIPYRSLYSKNINNLLLAGRNISVSHMAFGSTRDMATAAVVGQAVGTAGAMAVREGLFPRDISKDVGRLQQALLRDDCYIPGIVNMDENDLAKGAAVTCSSEETADMCRNIISGPARNIAVDPKGGRCIRHDGGARDGVDITKNGWISGEISDNDEWISLTFGRKITPAQLRIAFDSDLCHELTPSIEERVLRHQIPGIPSTLVKDFSIGYYADGALLHTETKRGNIQRFNICEPEKMILCDQIKIVIHATHGDNKARIFEVRVYEQGENQ